MILPLKTQWLRDVVGEGEGLLSVGVVHRAPHDFTARGNELLRRAEMVVKVVKHFGVFAASAKHRQRAKAAAVGFINVSANRVGIGVRLGAECAGMPAGAGEFFVTLGDEAVVLPEEQPAFAREHIVFADASAKAIIVVGERRYFIAVAGFSKANQPMLTVPTIMAHGVLVRTIAVLNTIAVFIVAIVMATEQR